MKTRILQQLVMAIGGVSVSLAMFCSSAIGDDSPKMRYQTQKSKVYYNYNVRITVDTPSEISTYAGQISYEGRASKSGDVGLKFQGGSKKSTKAKGRLTGFGP
jgi:hypothetical protein